MLNLKQKFIQFNITMHCFTNNIQKFIVFMKCSVYIYFLILFCFFTNDFNEGKVITIVSVKLAPHYPHFWTFMRVLTSFAIVLEFLICFRNSSSLLMYKKCDFQNAELTSRISTLSEKQKFSPSSGKI